jgi:hypothetical protein
MCAVQGIPIDAEAVETWGHHFAADLAGNAFCTPVVTSVIMSMLVVVGRHAGPLPASSSRPHEFAPPAAATAVDPAAAAPAPATSAADASTSSFEVGEDSLEHLDMLVAMLTEGL